MTSKDNNQSDEIIIIRIDILARRWSKPYKMDFIKFNETVFISLRVFVPFQYAYILHIMLAFSMKNGCETCVNLNTLKEKEKNDSQMKP